MTLRLQSRFGDLLERPVAVFGGGASGRAVVDLLHHNGIRARVYDECLEVDAEHLFSENEAGDHRLVVVSPGFSPSHPWMAAGRNAGCHLLGELDLASTVWRRPVIGVTGTNGKTTTAEFLAFALRSVGQPAFATGNNGYPLSRLCLDCTDSDAVAVCEVSSFQAEVLGDFSADALLWTTFAEDHLERHGTMQAYFETKWKLFETLNSEQFFAGPTVRAWAEKFGFSWPEFAVVPAPKASTPINIPGDCFFANNTQRGNFGLIGEFWRDAGYGVEWLRQAAIEFDGPPHRLQKIGEFDRVAAWNDSKATNFSATLAALGEFQKPVLWIGGGKLKGGDVSGFAQSVAARIKSAFLIGESAARVAGELRKTSTEHHRCETLEDAVRCAWDAAVPGDAIVLSPGFASLDMFENFADRGNCFERAVLGLKKHTPPD